MSLGKPPSVLVADDQADILHAMRVLLRGEKCKVKTVIAPDDALDAMGGAMRVGYFAPTSDARVRLNFKENPRAPACITEVRVDLRDFHGDPVFRYCDIVG